MKFSIVYIYGLFIGFISSLIALSGFLMVLERAHAALSSYWKFKGGPLSSVTISVDSIHFFVPLFLVFSIHLFIHHVLFKGKLGLPSYMIIFSFSALSMAAIMILLLFGFGLLKIR